MPPANPRPRRSAVRRPRCSVAADSRRPVRGRRIWANCYHAYPAGATFGGYKESGIGRETHKSALAAYQQVKCVLTSYEEKPLGFF